MRKIWKKITSLVLAVLLVLPTMVSPVLAAEKEAPSEVKSCTSNGFMTEYLALEFEDTDWMNSISSVTVNDTKYTKGTISSWGSDSNVWEVGSVTGSYGSYTALKLVSSSSYPAIIQISATGYENLELKVTKNTSSYPYTYTATVNKTSSGEKTYTATVDETVNGKVEVSPSKNIKEKDTVTVTATPDTGYELDKIIVKGVSKTVDVQEKDGKYTFVMPAENVTVSALFKAAAPVEPSKIQLSQVSIGTDFFGNDWELTFANADGYVSAITGVTVNEEAWEATSFSPSAGGKYYKNSSDNKLVFAAKNFGASETIPVLKSGDVITITANGYEDLTFKFVIDTNGKASLQEDDGQGDPYELHVKIDGTFEAAIVGQKDYDGVSSATVSGSSSNKNSAVKVYGALTEKGTEPAESDWEELDNTAKINLNGSKCSVSIVPDTAKGTAEDSDSGMEGVYMTISSDLTLNGTPKDAGSYLISVSITDMQGRTAVSNSLPFRIYTGEETLVDQIKKENLRQFANGLYAWDIMEPWAIKNFGSNVEGETESVRVPADLEVWYGSHESGTYGYLGYDLPWKQVLSGDIPQTLYIPAGCNLTIENMKILSSVHIIVENGGKLTLSDSVVQGIIDVQNGGTFSMNYDAYNSRFTTGASVCGQIRLADGAILENAAIYSHANYLANGDLKDRTTSEPVVTATGNVTIKGNVFIQGDEAGNEIGQTALRVKDGTLTLEDGATLAAFGGGGNVLLYAEGGAALELDNGVVTGNGKLITVGGDVLWGNGGTAVKGNGVISTSEAFLQGSTSRTSNNAEPGKATDGNVKVTSAKRHVEDGTQIGNEVQDDPLEDLYWKTGIDATPNLGVYETEQATNSFAIVEIPDAVYTGEDLRPNIVVKDEELVLTEGTDYTLSFLKEDGTEVTGELKEAGTYTVVVNGIGNYAGLSQRATFTIKQETPNPDNGNTNPDNGNTNPDNGNTNPGNTTNNNGNGNNKNTGAKTANTSKSVQTGDSSNFILWISLMALACGAVAGVMLVGKKHK